MSLLERLARAERTPVAVAVTMLVVLATGATAAVVGAGSAALRGPEAHSYAAPTPSVNAPPTIVVAGPPARSAHHLGPAPSALRSAATAVAAAVRTAGPAFPTIPAPKPATPTSPTLLSLGRLGSLGTVAVTPSAPGPLSSTHPLRPGARIEAAQARPLTAALVLHPFTVTSRTTDSDKDETSATMAVSKPHQSAHRHPGKPSAAVRSARPAHPAKVRNDRGRPASDRRQHHSYFNF